MNDDKMCRICLDENADLDWNNFLGDQSLLTCKDFYYSLTKLEPFNDSLSTVLCRNCFNCFENINIFISKAKETHNLLLKKVALQKEEQNVIKQEQKNFEFILVETDIQHETQSFEIFEDCSEDYVTDTDNCSISESSAHLSQSTNEVKQIKKDQKEGENNPSKQPLKPTSLLEKKRRKKKRQIETPTCCTICSKVLASKYNAIRHEKVHHQNRERNSICAECGLKFYDKRSLAIHVKIHSEDREKAFKCEFCDKAFFNKGGLNVHRRIHLGQMIPCTLCAKEYARQFDLDKHMATHSAARIHNNLKLKKKFYFVCQFCGEKIRSVSYKSHIAKHKNVPLFKCSLCDKEFFSRASCTSHLKLFHKKGNGERANLIIGLKTNRRCSNLYMQQKSCNVFIEE